MTILEKKNKLKLTLPRVVADIKLDPKVKHPLPDKSGFCLSIIGPAGSGKTSTMVSLIKSKDVYRKRFHNMITVIPSSSLNSLASNPFKSLPDEQKFEELTYETLEEVVSQLETNRDNEELSLLIMDDISAELQDPGLLKKMMRVFLNRRHLYTSIICISHSLTGKGALPYTIRKNCSHMLIFRPSSGMEVLNQEFLHLPKDKFRELTDYVFDQPHNHLMIKMGVVKLYKNFNDIEQK